MNINKLKDEIAHQIRNGRTQVFIKREDLEELGIHIEGLNERVFAEASYILGLIRKYEQKQFKQGLKVDVKPTIEQKHQIEKSEKLILKER